jgi:hypothetical protein
MARSGRPPQERREAVGVENHIFLSLSGTFDQFGRHSLSLH